MNKENMKMEILDLNNEEDTKTTDDMEPKCLKMYMRA